jgi:hypothetical protein
MKRNIAHLQHALRVISAILLLAGLGSAVLIYLTAGNDSSRILGYEEEGGSVYPIMPEDSRRYLRDLELYSGRAGVLADEFSRWFAGLWHGKSLAYTVACIAILISSGVFYVSHLLPYILTSDFSREKNRDGTR